MKMVSDQCGRCYTLLKRYKQLTNLSVCVCVCVCVCVRAHVCACVSAWACMRVLLTVTFDAVIQ